MRQSLVRVVCHWGCASSSLLQKSLRLHSADREGNRPSGQCDPIRCFDAARQKAAAWSAGCHRPGYLHALPVLIQLTAFRGVPFTQGSLIYKDHTAQQDEPFFAVLLQSRAIIVGKTNMPDFGAKANTFRVVLNMQGLWENKKPKLTAGGSSGGTAAALAAGNQAV